MPDALTTEAEWRFFQAGLDRADVIVLGRASHEATPNVKGRRRLIVSRQGAALERLDEVHWRWDPERAAIDEALAGVDGETARIAVVGGRDVFGLFLTGPARFSTFFLSRLAGVRLTGGRHVFPGMPDGAPHAPLARAGCRRAATRRLDSRCVVEAWRQVDA